MVNGSRSALQVGSVVTYLDKNLRKHDVLQYNTYIITIIIIVLFLHILF